MFTDGLPVPLPVGPRRSGTFGAARALTYDKRPSAIRSQFSVHTASPRCGAPGAAAQTVTELVITTVLPASDRSSTTESGPTYAAHGHGTRQLGAGLSPAGAPLGDERSNAARAVATRLACVTHVKIHLPPLLLPSYTRARGWPQPVRAAGRRRSGAPCQRASMHVQRPRCDAAAHPREIALA